MFSPGSWRRMPRGDRERWFRYLRERQLARLNSANQGRGRVSDVSDEEANKRNPALKPNDKKTDASQLKPEKVDYLVKENAEVHHTDDYDERVYGLVVRRGQTFKLQITFDRNFDKDKDQLIIQLAFGNRPQESKSTLIRIHASTRLQKSSWSMRIDKVSGRRIDVTLLSPANSLVGEYQVLFETKTKGYRGEFLTIKKTPDEERDKLIVLFNAWCEDDAVFMKEENDRQEYVMNSEGSIWVGSARRNGPKPWNFGQFEDVSLRTCLFVLDLCQGLSTSSRGDPTMIARFLSKIVNSSDNDGGILTGNWSGEYDPYTNPSKWAGSVKILQEYDKLENKEEGVKYGQCWVFSGLVTTLGRALGIPTRSVTNFQSAHDTDSSTSIDFHFDSDGDPIKYLDDSIWNFHVWNECYFKRSDLPPGVYDGWQAIDATPQEQSEGSYCCGPSPVKAIKEGSVYIPHDTRFVFGEVNGDKVYWLVEKSGEMSVIKKITSAIGKIISTKAVGKDERHDITLEYKFPEGEKEERAAVRKAFMLSSRRDDEIYKSQQKEDINFDFIPPSEDLMVGSDFDVKLKMKNTTDSERRIDVTIVTMTAFYTGIDAVPLDKMKKRFYLHPRQETVATLGVQGSKYLTSGPSETNVIAYLSAKVVETSQVFCDSEIIELSKPKIHFEFNDDNVRMDKKFQITMSFVNPLNVSLDNCEFNIETARYISPDTITEKLKKPVRPQEKASITVTLHPIWKGRRYVIAQFSSDQLTGIEGKISFQVKQ